MDIDAFERSFSEPTPPDDLSPLLVALWLEARGDWDGAHKLAQSEIGPDAAWVHAYLHRVEGDEANAGYWYDRSGHPRSTTPLADERRHIAADLLART